MSIPFAAARANRSTLIIAALLISSFSVSNLQAQVDEVLESPRAVVSQVVGLEPITITYHSPGVKERTIWGELVPYGKNWRAGANDKTVFEFGEPVLIDGTTLEVGAYGFYVLPVSDEEWQLVLNSSTTGSPNEFDKSKDVLRVTVRPEEAPFRERLRYSVDNFTDWPPFTAKLTLHWESVKVELDVEIKTAFEVP